MKMRNNRLLSMLLTVLALCQTVSAQTDPTFTLNKEDGHFYLNTTLNGINTKMMLESGVPALMINCAFYEKHKEALQLDVKESDAKINYLGGISQIKYTAQARLSLGDAFFEGPVMIVDRDIEVQLPIHMLRHPADNSAIVRLDLQTMTVSVCPRGRLQDIVGEAAGIDLTFNQWDMPVVTTRLTMRTRERKLNMQGPFIIDMGNASLLFLNKTNEAVWNMLDNGKMKLQEARNKKGELVAEGLYAEKLTICDRKYEGVSVGISDKMVSIKESGMLGLKFFVMPAVFDFDNRKLYLCK